MSRHAIFLQTGNLLLMTPGTQGTKTKVAQTNRGHSNTVTLFAERQKFLTLAD